MTNQTDQSIKIIGQKHRLCATFFLWVLTMTQVHAIEETMPTALEMNSLPPYCQAKLNAKSPNLETWSKYFGRDTFGALHHYCFALNYMNRSYRKFGIEQRREVGFALNDFNYMLKAPNPKSPITPEMYLNRGLALRILHRDAEAISDYYKAIELNPKLAKAYSELADCFATKALTAKALELVTQGLGHLPDNKMLQRNYTKYGGKLPYPEPLVRPEEKPAAGPTTITGQPEESKPVVNASTITPQSPYDTTEKKVVPDSLQPTQEHAVPTKGTDKSPWCRFCPE